MSQESAGNQAPGPRRRNLLPWTIGLVAAGALAVGGIVAGASLAGHASPAASTSAAGPGSQAAALNTAINSANAAGALALTSSGASASGASASGGSTAGGSTAGHPCRTALKTARADREAGNRTAARAALKAAGPRCRALRHRLFRVALRRGVDGQFTFRGKGGVLRTLAFERGVVQSVSGSDVVVRAADGTTWSWDLVSSTVVRESGQKASTSAVTTGEPVWVGGPVVSGARDARLIVVRPPSASSSPSPAPSASSSSTSGSSTSGS